MRFRFFYAGRHRGSFVISYGLGILAVFCELVADLVFRTEAHQLARLLLRLTAVLAVSSILTVWLWASSQHWNERRIDYRFLAELFRQLRFLRLVGRPAKMLLLPPHTAYASAETSWIGWYLHAVAREAGMVGASFTAEYLEAVRILLREDLVKGQIGFHAEAAARLARAERVLRWCGFATFAAAWSLLVFLILRENAWIATFAAAAPVLGAALAAIRGQAELERLAKRSQAMCAQLSRVGDQLTQQQATLTSAALGDVAESLAELMTSEVLDWRVVFLGRLMELTS